MAVRSIKNTADLKKMFFTKDVTDETNIEDVAKEILGEEPADTDSVVEEPEVIEEKDETPNVTDVIEEEEEDVIPSFLQTGYVAGKEKEKKEEPIEVETDDSVSYNHVFGEFPSDFSFDLRINNKVNDADFLGKLEVLTNYVDDLEKSFKLTLPVSVYGITAKVIAESQKHEIVQFDNILFLSNTQETVNEVDLYALIDKINVAIAISGEFRTRLVNKKIVEYMSKYVSVPTLLVNTYEYNSIRKVFEGKANVMTVEDHGVTYLEITAK